ncbi:MAG: NAD+ synthase [Candidatus Latescibacteria bacterium]|nr:NAD+ synthase [Candidatus Latescibacterota bacterium]
MRPFRIALAQTNTTVGDLDGNARKILDAMAQARDLGADLVALPELAVTGYPPEDLLFKPRFVDASVRTLRRIAAEARGIVAVVGFADRGDDIYNAAGILADGQVVDVYHKRFLPNYGVFDEDRYFRAGTTAPVYRLGGMSLGVNICEDIWYPGGPARDQALFGDADVILNISSSPYSAGKGVIRASMLATRAMDCGAVVAYCNLVGGQDELVFDGESLIFDQNGVPVARGRQFEEDLVLADLDVDAVFRRRLHDPLRRKEKAEGGSIRFVDLPPRDESRRRAPLPPRDVDPLDPLSEVYAALVTGVRDYVRKNRFEKVVIGISGGIDSAMVTTLAVDALGKVNVVGVTMPSQYSSEATRSDAYRLSENLGIHMLTIPIGETFDAYRHLLSGEFQGRPEDVTEENLQARIRGNLLMALSNKFGWLVLTTGDKSEMSVGFATLYGDMSGGFAVIKDIYKTLLYDLARHRNRQAGKDLIPRGILEREPSPELKPDQKASDTLPPYPTLDPILKCYVEQDMSLQEIVTLGFDEQVVQDVIRRVDRSEYKRRQAPPGIKVTPRAFGRDRRLPITNRYSEG